MSRVEVNQEGRWGWLVAALIALAALIAGLTLWPSGARASSACGDFEHPASTDTFQQFVVDANVQRQDTPNDPNYDQSENDTCQPPANRSTNFFDERYDLFGFPSDQTPGAIYRDGNIYPGVTNTNGSPKLGKPMVAGFNAAGAWKRERGRHDVVVAILDTGIKWDREGLRTQIHVNTGELPYPHVNSPVLDPSVNCATYDTSGTTFDPDHDGGANVLDYACDPRVSVTWSGRLGPPGKITAQDLIHRFGNCKVTNHQLDTSTGSGGCPAGAHFDNDHNGYANDIAGWNFFDNNNDPTDLSSYFAAGNHGSDRAEDAVERGNDGQGSIGVCPHCEFVPLRVWDTFVSDGNTFGQAITYATDNGIKVIEGADGSVDHTAFAEAASRYAYDHGVVQTFSGDDLNTANHNYPANYSHAMLIQGVVADSEGLGTNQSNEITQAAQREGVGTNIPVGTFFRGANTTQYGGKSSISMTGSTGSVNTGKASGAAGLVVSAGLDHSPPITLRPDEVRELLEQTAERVTTGNTQGSGTPDPGADPTAPPDEQWTSHFGWGRADVGRAVGAVFQGNIPPEAAIDSPDWFAPLTGSTLNIAGLARARFAPGGNFHWKLMWGPGFPVATSPTNQWRTVAEGNASGTKTTFAAIDLNAVRSALASFTPPPDSGGPVFSSTSPNPFQQQFTVQLEVSANDTHGNPFITGIDRRVFTTFSDPSMRSGYPKRMGTGGEAPLRYADLNGDNVRELIVPTEDGTIHAYEPNGSELPGWPVHTREQLSAQGHESSPALSAIGIPHEPPRGPVIADLDGTGKPDVITAAGTHIYAWHGDGTPVAGFPVSSNVPGTASPFCGPQLESQPLHHPKCGFAATPAVAHLEGYDKPPDIVAPSLDGHLYAFRANGTPVPGYPIALVDPNQPADQRMVAESINDPAIGNLTNDPQHPHDDVVVATNEEYGAPAIGSDVSFGGALAGAAGGSTRLYAVNGRTGKFLPGWPIKLPGAIQDVLPLVGPGHDPAIANIGGKTLIIASETGGDLATYDVTGAKVQTMQQQTYGPASNAKTSVDNGGLNLFESASVGDLLGTGTPDIVKYQVSLNQAANLLLVGQNAPYYHLIGAFDGSTGAPLPAWPTITDDYQFLSASDITQITPGKTQQVITGTGLGLLHAYDGATGLDVTGFPKMTGGWLFAPAAFSDDGRMADITREGYLFEWQVNQPACQTQWPSYRHDAHSSGNYNHDGTPPAASHPVTLTTKTGTTFTLRFKSPGDNGFCGTAAAYVAQVDGHPLALGAPVSGGSTFTRNVTLPAGAHTLTIQARDAAGNLGFPVQVAVPHAGGGATGATGPSGPTGTTGTSGASGASGITTPAGGGAPPGPLGPSGLTPTSGIAGTSAHGVTGTTGSTPSTCQLRRRLMVHLRAPRGARLRSVKVNVGGHRVHVHRGRRLRVTINLRGLNRDQITLKLVAVAPDGRVIRRHRTYSTCRSARPIRRHRRHRTR